MRSWMPPELEHTTQGEGGLGTFGRAGKAVVSKAEHMAPKDASWERGCNGRAAAFRPSTQAGWTRCVCARALARNPLLSTQ